LYIMYRVLYYSTTCCNPATGCYMIINKYTVFQKNVTLFTFTITSWDAARFSWIWTRL